jgi:fructose-specific component phosphotransferase system IIB-like protein
MKAIGILFSSITFLLFSCGAKHDRQQLEKINDTTTVTHQKLDSVPAETDTLEKLAAEMVASGESYRNDGNTEAEQVFIKAFIEALKKPEAFETNFANLKKYDIQVLTADDGKLRVFYWLSPYSGSMWHVQNIIQYKDENNEVTALSFNNLYQDKDDEGSPTPFFDHVYNLNTSPPKTYLFIGYGQRSGTEPYTVSHTLVIDHAKFSIDKALFKIGKAVKTQLFASAELKEDQDKEKLLAQLAITYNAKDKVISYPEVSETKNGSVLTGKRSVLTFRDGIFK